MPQGGKEGRMSKKGLIRRVRQKGQGHIAHLNGQWMVLKGLNFRSQKQMKTFHEPDKHCDGKCYRCDDGSHYCYNGGFDTVEIEDVIESRPGTISEILFGTTNHFDQIKDMLTQFQGGF